ncbi:DUF6090 family protein [Catalinimonas niigatensis]|uniref:DUF6090 family protein n=1 Tax=Catalinimonas niigatensis TaxID=1397264 RepID=UPI00266666A0|nr:DUF6090 family protein [Catalinimonas niigatensis]WPP51452.1 DUF6090 family protein [Catalinimonas niigatensis]
MRKFFASVHWGDKLVDIFVVVFSITIAFWLNNWREDRSNARQERAYLINLSEDLAKDSTDLAERQKEVKIVFGQILRLQEISSIPEKVDSIPLLMYEALNYDIFVFYPEDYTYKTLQQSGDIGLVQSDTVRQVLSHLYDNYQFIDLIKETAYFYQTNLVLPFYNNHDIRNGEILDLDVFSSVEFFNMIIYYRNTFRNYINVINDSLEKHRTLQQLIQAELEK